MSRIVTWEAGAPLLPRSVVAIGVFDGVHCGHQALLTETIADASERGASSVAITFDRDPDQVVTPENAAPQLLTLDDKLSFISERRVDTILVVPFTQSVAMMSPDAFLDSIVASALDVVSIHVGADFHFGVRASGDVNTLEQWARSHGIAVTGHQLVSVDGAPVTSTRIRARVAAGDVSGARDLLCRPHRVSGLVVRGREAGRAIGFPTANMEPTPYAALPSDGVYAGTAILENGSRWPAAISVGTPPTFPEAREYLEVHLIGFEGHLYDQELTVEFLERLRDLRAFAALEDLSAAIAKDVLAAGAAAGRVAATPKTADAVDATQSDPTSGGSMQSRALETDTAGWVQVAETRAAGPMAALQGSFGTPAVMLAIPLDAANIPYKWEPFPPDEATVGSALVPRTFTLWVPAELSEQATTLLAEQPSRSLDSGDIVEAEATLEDEDIVEDEAALAAAQAAVNEATRLGMFSTIDVEDADAAGPSVDAFAWAHLAEGFAPGPIEVLSQSLNDAGIDTLWDPFPPEKRSAFWGRTELTVYVPLIQLGDARVLAEESGVIPEAIDTDSDA